MEARGRPGDTQRGEERRERVVRRRHTGGVMADGGLRLAVVWQLAAVGSWQAGAAV
jgi:hypothetical protein